jgi:hypothetical protein
MLISAILARNPWECTDAQFRRTIGENIGGQERHPLMNLAAPIPATCRFFI